jgi:tetratricopeptide (TPR) repeat protein
VSYDFHITPEELEQIDRFLHDQMSVAEAEAFAASVQADRSMQEKVQAVRLTILGINESVLAGKLNEYHKAVKPSQTVEGRIARFSGKWAFAAAALLLVCLGAWWTIRTLSTHQRLYSEYYQPDPGLMTLMSSGSNNYTFEKAMVEYKNGEYDKALKAWSTMLSERPDNDTLLYFIGAASQANSEKTAAIEYLQRVAVDSNSAFQKDACWYLGLAYLSIGEKGKAIDNLKRSEHQQSIALIHALTH